MKITVEFDKDDPRSERLSDISTVSFDFECNSHQDWANALRQLANLADCGVDEILSEMIFSEGVCCDDLVGIIAEDEVCFACLSDAIDRHWQKIVCTVELVGGPMDGKSIEVNKVKPRPLVWKKLDGGWFLGFVALLGDESAVYVYGNGPEDNRFALGEKIKLLHDESADPKDFALTDES